MRSEIEKTSKMVDKSVLFSIIMPIYRVEAFLPQAIESVLAQRGSDWELILVDDGSPDRCGEICDRYAEMDSRIHVIHKRNEGAASARLAGMEQCNGTYILTLDGDDYWDRDFLSSLREVVALHQPDGVLFGFRRVNEAGKVLSETKPGFSEGIYQEGALKKIWDGLLYDPSQPALNTGTVIYSQCCSAFRREIVVPFQRMVPKNIKMGEDAAVTISAVCHCERVYFLNKILYNYLVRKTSASYTFFESTMEETMQLIDHLQENAPQIPEKNLDGFLFRMADNYWIKAARNLPSYQEFRRCAKAAFQLIPENTLRTVSAFPLHLNQKLRYYAAKNRMWFLFWLVYHRK